MKLLLTVVFVLCSAVSGQAQSVNFNGIKHTFFMPNVRIGDAGTEDDAIVLENPTASDAVNTIQSSPSWRLVTNSWVGGANHKSEIICQLHGATSNFSKPLARASHAGHTLSCYSRSDGTGTNYEIFRLQGNGNLLTSSGYDGGMGPSFNPNGTDQAGDISTAPSGGFYWRHDSTVGCTQPCTRVILASTARGLFAIEGSEQLAEGFELNVGTAAPTVSSGFGTTPSIETGSTNTTGAVNVGTGSSATSGVVAFASPAWTNDPFCVVSTRTGTSGDIRNHGVTATTTTMTITTTPAWNASTVLVWHCFGQR